VPYSDSLFDTSLWFSQLWAESLGKRFDLDGKEVCTGQTPVACRGPADQHSLLQLFMEGPPDTFFTFLTVPQEDAPLSNIGIPGLESRESFSYLLGKSLADLRDAEAEATATALSRRDLPVVLLELPDHGPRTMGALFMLLELVTVLTGFSLNINPLDQPGVELGKKLTFSFLGRPGYEPSGGEGAV
jgi:glucose-6-phosphate isomerase